MKVSKVTITKASVSKAVDAQPRASRVTSEWLDNARRPPRLKRPSIFGAPEPIQKVKTYG